MTEKLFLAAALLFIAGCVGAVIWAASDPTVALIMGAP